MSSVIGSRELGAELRAPKDTDTETETVLGRRHSTYTDGSDSSDCSDGNTEKKEKKKKIQFFTPCRVFFLV